MTDKRKEEIKALLKDYLEKILGINTRKHFRCLNPEHEDKNPSSSYNSKNNTVHCFSCPSEKKTYDIFDIVSFKTGLKGQELFDFTEALCVEKLGLKPLGAKEVQKVSEFLKDKAMDQNADSKANVNYNVKKSVKEKYSEISYSIEDIIKVNEYVNKCKEHLKETDYFTNRGITKEIQEKFYLGFDPNFKTSAGVWEGAVIRTSWTSYIVRNTDPAADKRNRIRKSSGESFLFNFKHITKMTDDYIFICEGEFDVLSFETVGACAVGLGGVSNIDELVDLLKEYRPQKPVILVLDNDKVGRQTTNKLIEKLENEKICFYNCDWLYGEYKDANELLIADKEKFKKNIERAKIKAIPEGETYKIKSNADYIQSFIDDIYHDDKNNFISTGFKNLDEVLGGGLREGLYVVGAIPSLGKTTLISQICDNIAAAGRNILFFSLEMSRRDIIAKSISRNTLLESIERYKAKTTSRVLMPVNKTGNVKIVFEKDTFAKTTNLITTGSKYKNYTDEQMQVIEAAFDRYAKYADNFYVIENNGNMNVEFISETVEKHKEQTGKTPLVVVDYLQIITPQKQGMTDKQNADNTMLELKRISRTYKTPVIAISSFNRASYKETVDLSSFKESGGVEYGSDVIIGLQFAGTGKETDLNYEKSKNIRNIELWILKNRNGATGKKINFNYTAMFNHFEEV